MKKIRIEGWRFIPHSYAVVNQWQCLSFLQCPDITLSFLDVPYFSSRWRSTAGLFPEQQEEALCQMRSGTAEEGIDALLRISFPYNYRPSRYPVWVFGTSEFGCVTPSMVSNDLSDIEKNNINIVTPSRWSAKGFLNSGVNEKRISVIPHGVDPSIFQPNASVRDRARRHLNLNGFTFLSVGSMTWNKGIDLLLTAFAAVCERHPDARLLLKGTDDLYTSGKLLDECLKNLSQHERQRIISRIIYIGGNLSMEKMASLYQAADAYVSPYRAEGFNLPILEAAACGLPVICTDGGASDDFTTSDFSLHIASKEVSFEFDGCLGFRLEPNVEHLVTLLGRVIEDSAWRQSACLAGPTFTHAQFTWDIAVRKLLRSMNMSS